MRSCESTTVSSSGMIGFSGLLRDKSNLIASSLHTLGTRDARVSLSILPPYYPISDRFHLKILLICY